ncbi:hypothetical protein PENTCL1PPCAC_27519, partial [Pristionchus entomophagus]
RMLKRRRVGESSDGGIEKRRSGKNTTKGDVKKSKEHRKSSKSRAGSSNKPIELSSSSSSSSVDTFVNPRSEEETRRDDRGEERRRKEDGLVRKMKAEQKEDDDIQVVFCNAIGVAAAALPVPNAPMTKSKNNEIRLLKAELEKAKEREKLFSTRINDAQTEASKLTGDLCKANMENSSLKKQLVTSWDALRAAEHRAETAEVALDSKTGIMMTEMFQSQNSQLNEKVIQLNKTIEQMSDQMAIEKKERERENEEYGLSIEELQRDYEKADEEHKTEKQKNAELWRQIRDSREKQSSTSAEVVKLNEEVTRLNRVLEKAVKEAGSHLRRAEFAESHMDVKPVLSPVLQQENIRLLAQIDQLMKEKQELEKEAQRQALQSATKDKEAEERVRDFEEEIGRWDMSKNRATQEEIDRLDALLVIRDIVVNTLKEQLKEANDQVKEIRTANGRLIAENAEKSRVAVQATLLDKKLTEKENELSVMKESHLKQRQKLRSSNATEMEEVLTRYGGLMSEIVELKNKLSSQTSNQDMSALLTSHKVVLQQRDKLQADVDMWLKWYGENLEVAGPTKIPPPNLHLLPPPSLTPFLPPSHPAHSAVHPPLPPNGLHPLPPSLPSIQFNSITHYPSLPHSTPSPSACYQQFAACLQDATMARGTGVPNQMPSFFPPHVPHQLRAHRSQSLTRPPRQPNVRDPRRRY